MTSKSRRSNTIRYDGANARTIDGFINEQRDVGHSMRSLQSTDRMVNYGFYQMADESGGPYHYLLDTVDRGSSSESENPLLRGSIDTNRLLNTSTAQTNPMYASQRASLFEEFVDQTLTNFS